MAKKIVKEIIAKTDEEKVAHRPYYGKEVKDLIDRDSVVSYMNNYLKVVPAPLKPSEVGMLWKIDGVCESADAIMAHLDRRAKILKEQGRE